MDTARLLPRKFARARLDVEVLAEPLVAGRRRAAGLESIVQLDITPPTRGAQRFRIYPGAPDNRIEVLGPDAPRRQLVLFIDEPRRAFETWIPKRQVVPPDARVLRETATSRAIEQFTPGRKRHFLCGMDEQHLFIAELPCGASSTHAAREALRAPEVPSSLRLRGEKIVRQGEWFFLPLPAGQSDLLDRRATLGPVQRHIGIAQAAGISRSGRPHVADEVLVEDGGPRWSVRTTYVRGAVRHPDHQTIVFRDWMRVVPNRERSSRPDGVLWID